MNSPALIEPVSMPPIAVHDNLAKVYERVEPNEEKVGERVQGALRDLSTNGALLSGEPMPLLSRIACSFELDGFGQIEAIGWTLWRRGEDCEVPRADGSMVTLPKGFGVLFEAISLDARIAIHELVSNATAGKN